MQDATILVQEYQVGCGHLKIPYNCELTFYITTYFNFQYQYNNI